MSTSRIRALLGALAFVTAAAVSNAALAERMVTDQIGRTVKLADKIERAVVLQHQTLDIVAQIDGLDVVVGVLDDWKKQLGPEFARLAPRVSSLPTPGGLERVNIEALLALKPDVVFVTNYAPKAMIDQIEGAGLPVIAVSLRTDAPGEAAKLNPSLQDEEKAYSEGLPAGIRLIAEVIGRTSQAEALIADISAKHALVAGRIGTVAEAERVRAYMANPDLTTYGSGKYTGLMMSHAGALNVAAASIKGFKQVTMEDVLKWNPATIFVQERYPAVVDEIKTSPAWAGIAAVRAGRIHLMPQYAKAWGYPTPEAWGLGEMWMAKKLYPAAFADIDMAKEADAYYRRFYRVGYDGAQ